MDVKLSICLTTGGTIKTDTVSCLLDSLFYLPYEKFISAMSGGYKQYSLTLGVQKALNTNCTHIMFIDNDMIFPPDGIKRLIDCDKDIVAAPYNEKRLPLVSTVKLQENGKYIDSNIEGKNDLFEVAAIGLGFMLVKLSVFISLDPPWFNAPMDEKNEFKTDDVYFCEKAREHKYTIWCNPKIGVLHEGGYLY